MDLTPQANADHVERAKSLAMRGLFNYQPLRLSEDFYCGAGMSIDQGHPVDPPTVYCPVLDPAMSEYARQGLAAPADEEEFYGLTTNWRRSTAA